MFGNNNSHDPGSDQMHPEDKKNLLTFIIVAVIIWIAFDHYLLKPRVEALREVQEQQRTEMQQQVTEKLGSIDDLKSREEIIPNAPRLQFENSNMYGSVSLVGARLDDASLSNYHWMLHGTTDVSLFSPAGSHSPRYATFGWIVSGGQKTPDKNTRWSVEGGREDVALVPGRPVTLYWENGTGMRFEQDIEVDDKFLFTVTQRAINNTGRDLKIQPYGAMAQHGLPADLYGRWIVHEGPIGYIDGELTELSYKKIIDKKLKEVAAKDGWIALTEHYWFTGLFPEGEDEKAYRFVYMTPEEAGHIQPRYQVDYLREGKQIGSGGSYETVNRVYVGPKKLDMLEAYQKKFGWKHIDLSIDFGMYYFLTWPLFKVLHWLGNMAGNFGLGIIMLTFVVRLFVFPLANTSYRSFASLRKVAPQMTELREKYGDDKEKLQAALVKLYEKEKVNPMAGCLPILIQIPIFFALFKTLQISVEMRHAPFYGWVHDLSAPDPTSVFNLFGLIPWDPPQAMMIGAWPCMMLVFMILQKKMNPPPQDKMQKTMMDIMPFFITYILSQYAVGLVIYWTFSNGLSVLQQYIIMKSMGVEPHLFKTKEQKELEKKIAEGPTVHPELEVIEHDIEDALFGDGDDEDGEKKPAKKTAAKKKAVSKPKPKKSKKKK